MEELHLLFPFSHHNWIIEEGICTIESYLYRSPQKVDKMGAKKFMKTIKIILFS